MPRSQSQKSASTKRLAQINDLVSGLGRVASGLRQKSNPHYQLSTPHQATGLRQKSYTHYQLSNTPHQATSLLAVPIESFKVPSLPLSISYLLNTGCLKLKRKAIDDGVEPPAKRMTLARRNDMLLRKVRTFKSFKCIFL